MDEAFDKAEAEVITQSTTRSTWIPMALVVPVATSSTCRTDGGEYSGSEDQCDFVVWL